MSLILEVCSRMEESLRGMVHLKSKCDVLVQEKAAITAAYEVC